MLEQVVKFLHSMVHNANVKIQKNDHSNLRSFVIEYAIDKQIQQYSLTKSQLLTLRQ
jgi:hypothetical protein